jgi:hypothetical protein
MPQNMGFRSNGVDEVRSLRKISTQLRLANLSVNGASSASFASTFGAPTKRSGTPQNMSIGSNGLDLVHSLRKILTQLCLANLGVNGASLAILHRLPCTNETVRNAPKYEFCVQWSGCVCYEKFRRDFV